MERDVDFGAGRVERYHAIEQAEYVCILAITPEGLIPAMRQYRPALERDTPELTAGMVGPGESAESTRVRELREETGLVACRVHRLGVHAADSGRLSNMVHSFLVETDSLGPESRTESGIEVAYIGFPQLQTLVLAGEFDLQIHVAAIGVALMRPDTASILRGSRGEHVRRRRVKAESRRGSPGESAL
jgi:ADP-ribose pyrophosphatase